MALLSQYRTVGRITAATKANPCVITVDQPPLVSLGDSIFIRGSGFAALDEKWSTCGAVAGSTITMTGINTTSEPGTLVANGGVITASALPSERRV